MSDQSNPGSSRSVEELLRPERGTEWFRWSLTGFVLLALAWSLTLDVDWARLVDLPGQSINIAWLMVRHPTWSELPKQVSAMGESVAMAWLGTLIAAAAAVPLSFLAAENLVGRFVATITRQVFNVLRAIPELVLAILFVPVFGLSPVAGVLALGIGSIGTLGKLCYEIIEGLDRGPIEAVEAAGGNGLQRLRWGVLPQVLPELASFVMYRFEVNVRASAVLGVVGAGGIGGLLSDYLRFAKDWSSAGLALVVVILATILVDAVSGRIRRRIVGGPAAERRDDGSDDIDPMAAALIDAPPAGPGVPAITGDA